MVLDKIRPFFRRLRRNTSANVLMIAAIAMIPLMALIGSAVDVSRAYMAKTKLQSACDSAALAARRVMRNDTIDTTVTDTGTRFFAFNFPQNAFDTEAFQPAITRPSSGVVRVNASTRMQTTIMSIFGYDWLPVRVSCDASLNFVNTDVVLVLDVTGSMADPIGGVSKISSLQNAVLALYDELAPVQQQLQTQGLRLRYGIVPYSSTVNVGRLLYDRNPDYLRSSTPYQSRVANFNTNAFTANAPSAPVGAWEVSGSSLSSTDCATWVGQPDAPGGGPPPTATTMNAYSGTSTSEAYVAAQNWSYTGAPDRSGTTRSCRRWRIVVTTTYTTDTTRRRFTNWTHRQVTLNTSQFIQPSGSILLATSSAGTVPAPNGSYNLQQLAASGTGVTTASYQWNGCIEERDTTTSIDGGTSLTIPATAFDLDINRIPNNDATRWRPMLPEASYYRNAGTASQDFSDTNSNAEWLMNIEASRGYYACPAEATRLVTMTREEMDDKVTLLAPIGGTYHDIGMIWGARMISTGGVFADSCDEYNGMPCNRHLIFMTDGAQTAYCDVLTAYGVEENDLRATGSGSCPSQLARHQQRFRMICNAAKNMNVSVWVIAFATGLDSNLTGCASNASQASTSADQAALISRFRQIGNQIGALRLVK